MELRYTKADPTGNITALVEAFPAELSPSAAAAAVFAADRSIEQLGFISEKEGADIALTMAGGEFCGNACLCAAAYHLRRRGLERERVRVAISGAEKPVAVEIEKRDGGYVGTVDMPLPVSVSAVDTPEGSFPVVAFPGISHVIIPASIGRDKAESMIVSLCDRLGAEAVGIMLLDKDESSMTPLVYVPAADTLYWEHSCASGTAAVGAWKHGLSGGKISLALRQIGGVLSVAAEGEAGVLCSLRLGGCVGLGESEILKI